MNLKNENPDIVNFLANLSNDEVFKKETPVCLCELRFSNGFWINCKTIEIVYCNHFLKCILNDVS